VVLSRLASSAHPRSDWKALSAAAALLHYLFRERGDRREVMADDLARAAEESGHPKFAKRLRADFWARLRD
jgi:hypothetical protein